MGLLDEAAHSPCADRATAVQIAAPVSFHVVPSRVAVGRKDSQEAPETVCEGEALASWKEAGALIQGHMQRHVQTRCSLVVADDFEEGCMGEVEAPRLRLLVQPQSRTGATCRPPELATGPILGDCMAVLPTAYGMMKAWTRQKRASWRGRRKESARRC